MQCSLDLRHFEQCKFKRSAVKLFYGMQKCITTSITQNQMWIASWPLDKTRDSSLFEVVNSDFKWRNRKRKTIHLHPIYSCFMDKRYGAKLTLLLTSWSINNMYITTRSALTRQKASPQTSWLEWFRHLVEPISAMSKKKTQ